MTTLIEASLVAIAVGFVQAQGLVIPDTPTEYRIESTDAISKAVGVRAIGTCYLEDGKFLVLVSNEVDLRTPIGFSTLVHEVVHLTQKCPTRKQVGVDGLIKSENQAYDIQNKFLASVDSAHRVDDPYHPEYFAKLKALEKELTRLKAEAARLRREIKEFSVGK